MVFGQELAPDPDALKRHQKPPLPFAFSFPVSGGQAGTIECRLVVAGSAIACLDMLLEGFSSLLSGDEEQRRCQILSIESCDYQGTRLQLGHGSRLSRPENLVVLSSVGILESRAWNLEWQEIRLLTPLKLLSEGRQLTHFSFALFARSLLRRISSLAYYYGGCQADCDFRDLSRQADAIALCEDHFVTACLPGGGRRLSGIAGHGCFSGDFSGLLPFLALGTYLNAGKTAAFGLGNFTLA
ncbi:hypothetical protein GSbR_24340 [Geobacter sp. SVR]|nr:hypothetical protein GSbR_24340 [Geobacter sp. SVR]